MEILGNLVHPLKSILVTGELPDSVGDQDDKLPAHQPGLSVLRTQMEGEREERRGRGGREKAPERKSFIGHMRRRSQWPARCCRRRCCSSFCGWEVLCLTIGYHSRASPCLPPPLFADSESVLHIFITHIPFQALPFKTELSLSQT